MKKKRTTIVARSEQALFTQRASCKDIQKMKNSQRKKKIHEQNKEENHE